MKTKKILALLLAAVMLTLSLVSCGSAYKTPKEYITLPDFGTIEVKYADLKKEIDDQIKELLKGSAGQVFEPVTDENAVIKKGDQVYLDYTFKSASVELAESIRETLSAEDLYLTIGSDNSTFPVDYTNKNNDKTDDDKDAEGNDAETTVLVEGVEKQLIGKKVGDKFDVTGTFSNSYSTTELKNVSVTYEIEIKAIARISIDKDFKVKLSYTVTDDKSKVENILVPEITTTKAPVTTETPTTTEAPTTTAAATTTEVATTTTTEAATTTTEKPTFDKLFPGKSDTEYELAKTTATFGTIFTIGDFLRYLEGHTIYDEFAIPITVPEDYADEKYADYRGKEIYYTVSIKSTTAEPKWTDYFINKSTAKEYETCKAYEEYLTGEYKKTLAYDAILEATVVKEYPYKEWKKSYESYVELHLLEFIKEEKNLSTTPSLSDFTPAEIDAIVSDAEYAEIRNEATYSARTAIKQRLVMEALFEELNITLTKKEFKAKLAEEEEEFEANWFTYYYYYGISDFDMYVKYYGGKEYFELQYKYEALLEKLPTVVSYEEKPATDAQ